MARGTHDPGSSTNGLMAGIVAWLFRPTDLASLVFFRIAFGLVMCWEVVRYLVPRGSGRSWIESLYVIPDFHFTYWGFGWVQPWPGNGMVIHFVVTGIAALMIAAGLLYRVAAVVFFLCWTYIFLLEQTHYQNHFYLISLIGLLMVIVPAHRALSLDALLRPRLRGKTIPMWALFLVAGQFGIAYFYGGIAKLNMDWLSGASMRLFLVPHYRAPIVGPVFQHDLAPFFFALGGVALDLFVVPLLLWRKSRPFAFAAAAFFHLSNSYLFNIGIFPWMMLAATTLFLPPSWPRRVLRLVGRRGATDGAAGDGEVMPDAPRSTYRRLIVGFVTVYVLIQLLVPFRHHLFPGDPAWTEEGHLFAWRMMLRLKRAEPAFIVFDRRTGRDWLIDPHEVLGDEQARQMCQSPEAIETFQQQLAEQFAAKGVRDPVIRAWWGMMRFRVRDAVAGREWVVTPIEFGLSPRQASKSSGKPYMIIQLAHAIREKYRDEGYGDIEVRAEAWLSLHGRPFQWLVDPTVDLAELPRTTFRHDPWIVPLDPMSRPDPNLFLPQNDDE